MAGVMGGVSSGIDQENVMKLTRVWVGFALGAGLLAGCAGRAPVVEPAAAPDNTALEARLVGLDARLADLEQALAAERAEWRARAMVDEKALADIQRELKATKVAVASLRRKVEAPPPEARRDVATTGRGGSNAAYRPVDVALGELPSGNGERAARPIPTTIPSTAREILVYAQVATGYVKGGPHRFRIATRLDGDREAAFYLYAVGQPQQSWGYNSDNVWLPMPKNRELILQTEGEPFFGDWNSEVRIIGYR